MISCIDILLLVLETECKLKHKLCPENAFFKANNFDIFKSVPGEILHQFLIGLFGEHIIPAAMYEYTMTLRREDLVTVSQQGNKQFVITNK